MENLKEIYPKLETLYISQDLEMDGLQVAKDKDLPSKYLMSNDSFNFELGVFKSAFSFTPKNKEL